MSNSTFKFRVKAKEPVVLIVRDANCETKLNVPFSGTRNRPPWHSHDSRGMLNFCIIEMFLNGFYHY